MDTMNAHPPAILFPHCFIDPDRLKGAIALFGSLEICLPWEMNLRPDPVIDEAAPFLKIARPPEALKPGPGFGRRLAEYREWIKRHEDRSVLAFLSTLQERDASEQKSWEIRKRMREGSKDTETLNEERALKYHLLLHLAAETEESHHTAESLIDVIKTSVSPLSGALDSEEERPGLFHDLPSDKDQSLWQGYQWSQIVEAWLGLFHQRLANEKILLTLDPRLPDFLMERFEKALGEVSDRLFPEMITLQLPHSPRTLTMDEIAETGRKFFPQGISDDLEAALRTAANKRQSTGGKVVKDPVVRRLLGSVLVNLVN